jgi:hypothetical protein
MAHGYPDFEGDKSGLYLKPEWAAKEATDKNFQAYASNVVWGFGATVSYTVPVGKTLYITELTFRCYSFAMANADLPQHVWAFLINATAGVTPVDIGGNGGGQVVLNKPVVFTAGQLMTLEVWPGANHACNVGITAQGYEV